MRFASLRGRSAFSAFLIWCDSFWRFAETKRSSNPRMTCARSHSMSDPNIVILARRDDPFARVPKSMLNDDSLSWRAKGILSYLLGKPSGWKLRVSDLVNHGREGRDAVRSALNELRAAGYAEFVEGRSVSGRFIAACWKISDSPVFSPRTGKPDADLPDTVNPYVSKKEANKNDSTKNEPAIAESSTLLRPQDPPPPPLQHCAAAAIKTVKPAKSAKTSKNAQSPEGLEEAGEFRKLLPDGMVPPRNWQATWGATFDALADEGRGEAEMWRVIRWARADSFWSAHVMSPVALRKRSSGVQLYDRLLAVMGASDKKGFCAPRL